MTSIRNSNHELHPNGSKSSYLNSKNSTCSAVTVFQSVERLFLRIFQIIARTFFAGSFFYIASSSASNPVTQSLRKKLEPSAPPLEKEEVKTIFREVYPFIEEEPSAPPFQELESVPTAKKIELAPIEAINVRVYPDDISAIS